MAIHQLFTTARSILLAIALVLVSTTIVSAVSTGGVGGRPANPDPDNPRTQSIFIYTLSGGSTKTDQLYLSNGSDSDAIVELYPVDGVVTNTGAFTCEQRVESREGMGKWIELGKSEVTIPAKGTMLVDFTVTIPKTVDVGEHNGCIVIQKKDDGGVTTGNVNVRTRQAVRAAVTIPGDIYRKVTIEKFIASAAVREQNYSFSLHNQGNVSADVDVTLTLTNTLTGREVYTNGGQYVSIAGQNLDLTFSSDVHPFFGGWYKAQASIDYDKRAGVFGTYDKDKLIHADSESITIYIGPSVWAILLIIVLLMGAGAYALWLYRRKKAPTAKTLWGVYYVQPGETIEKLAARYSVSIQKLATLNRLPSPYTLEPGRKMYVPKKK